MPFDTHFQKLFRMAAGRPVSVFLQGTHTGPVPQTVADPTRGNAQWTVPAEVHQQILGGFCAGASLDWLRKVLQREDKRGVDHLKQSRVMRMAQTFANLDIKKAFEDSESHRVLKEALAQMQQELNTWVQQMGGTVNANGSVSISGTPQVLQMFQEKCAAKKAVFDQLQELIATYNSASVPGRRAMAWKELAVNLGSDGEKKRKFGGICPVAGSSNQVFATTRDYVVSLLSAPAWSSGRGMIVGLDFVPTPGHDIALLHDVTGAVFLFDPNLGVYKITQRTLLAMALIVLLEVGYAGKKDDGSIRVLGPKHDWQVFARTDGVPTVQPGGAYAAENLINIAYDEATDIIASFVQNVREQLDGELIEAQRLSLEHKQKQNAASQRAWVNAHNEATYTAQHLRDPDLAKIKAVYGGFTGSRINIV